MLEQQQQNILNNPQRKLLMLNIDAGGVQSRKIIDRLLNEEKSTSVTSEVAKFPNIRII
jgi:vanillate O-demethylase monooxygenase subunit